MEWTEAFKEEMRERHLRQIKMYLIVLGPIILIGIPFYYYFSIVQHRLGFGGVYDYYYLPLSFIYGCLYFPTFYVLIKKTPWIRPTSWLILFTDIIFVTLVAYCSGAPHICILIVYPMTIGLYSIYIHPIMATRFFVLSMVLLGGVSWLILQDIIPYFPIMRANTEFYPFLRDYMIRSENHIFTYISYGGGVAFSFATLVAINSIVKETRQKAEQISRLSEKLKVYLPHQFVESLADGDRDTQIDYRRRRLTIFFSDVKGFTRWTDKLEPEEVRELLNQYLSEMSNIARRWGGTIDKFIGDAVMVFFGDPEFTDDRDHAVRCVKMALEMQEKMFSLRREWEDAGYLEPLQIRIGINTGYATVGNFGAEDRLNYTALGSAVNLASRLEEVCDPDRITISHTTYSLIKNKIECLPKGEVEVKGFPEPVKIYEVAGIKSTGEKEA